MDPAVGQDVVTPLGQCRPLWRQAHQGKVGSTAADVGDQDQLFAVDGGFVVEGGGNGFVLERNILEADRPCDLFERILGQLIGGGIVIHKIDRTPQHHAVEATTGGAFATLLEFTDELREQGTKR